MRGEDAGDDSLIRDAIQAIDLEYIESVDLLSYLVKKELGFDPMVFGPKLSSGQDTVFFDTKQRRLYLLRDKPDPESLDGFRANSLTNEKDKWKMGGNLGN